MQITQTTIQLRNIDLHFPILFSQPYRLVFMGSVPSAVATTPVPGDTPIPGDGAPSYAVSGLQPEKERIIRLSA